VQRSEATRIRTRNKIKIKSLTLETKKTFAHNVDTTEQKLCTRHFKSALRKKLEMKSSLSLVFFIAIGLFALLSVVGFFSLRQTESEFDLIWKPHDSVKRVVPHGSVSDVVLRTLTKESRTTLLIACKQQPTLLYGWFAPEWKHQLDALCHRLRFDDLPKYVAQQSLPLPQIDRFSEELSRMCYRDTESSVLFDIVHRVTKTLLVNGSFIEIGGCGYSKMATAACISFAPFDSCVSIDSDAERVSRSQQLVAELARRQPHIAPRLQKMQMTLGDVASSDEQLVRSLFQNASVMYLNSICIDEERQAMIVRQMLRWLRRGARLVFHGVHERGAIADIIRLVRPCWCSNLLDFAQRVFVHSVCLQIQFHVVDFFTPRELMYFEVDVIEKTID
jgi:hypothetical protein